MGDNFTKPREAEKEVGSITSLERIYLVFIIVTAGDEQLFFISPVQAQPLFLPRQKLSGGL